MTAQRLSRDCIGGKKIQLQTVALASRYVVLLLTLCLKRQDAARCIHNEGVTGAFRVRGGSDQDGQGVPFFSPFLSSSFALGCPCKPKSFNTGVYDTNHEDSSIHDSFSRYPHAKSKQKRKMGTVPRERPCPLCFEMAHRRP